MIIDAVAWLVSNIKDGELLMSGKVLPNTVAIYHPEIIMKQILNNISIVEINAITFFTTNDNKTTLPIKLTGELIIAPKDIINHVVMMPVKLMCCITGMNNISIHPKCYLTNTCKEKFTTLTHPNNICNTSIENFRQYGENIRKNTDNIITIKANDKVIEPFIDVPFNEAPDKHGYLLEKFRAVKRRRMDDKN